MREPPTNKQAPKVERFPQRQGARVISDRALTPAEIRAAQEDQAAIAAAKAFRGRAGRKGLVNRNENRTDPIIVEGSDGP